ncbi:MAG: GNAT family N-acetyltransferase [Bryobacterales bacterium]|nr:GNAT family N-acetyltransferase [Bryobacterales bacterium]
MILVDLNLSRRLERAEGNACREFAEARQKLYPEFAATWREIGGGVAVYDGADSPITQCLGLGVAQPLIAEILDDVETFFTERGAHTDLELSPLAGVDALTLLCARGYHPIEISSVLVGQTSTSARDLQVAPSASTVAVAADTTLWSQVSTEAWAAELPDLRPFLEQMGTLQSNREHSVAFLAYYEGTPAAAALLSLHDGIAMFAGAATLPAYRRKGLQAALLQARMQYAQAHNCDLAMMVAEAGSGSQRNAQRQGFQIAYTRLKWRKEAPGPARPPAQEPPPE